MVKANEFKEKNLQETQDELQKRLDGYKEKVSQVTNLDELKKMEEEVIAEQDEFDEYLRGAEYLLDWIPLSLKVKNTQLQTLHARLYITLTATNKSFNIVWDCTA